MIYSSITAVIFTSSSSRRLGANLLKILKVFSSTSLDLGILDWTLFSWSLFPCGTQQKCVSVWQIMHGLEMYNERHKKVLKLFLIWEYILSLAFFFSFYLEESASAHHVVQWASDAVSQSHKSGTSNPSGFFFFFLVIMCLNSIISICKICAKT